MRWVLGASWRIFKFWSLWFGLLLFALLMLESADATLTSRQIGFLTRVTLFASTLWLLMAEWGALRAGLRAIAQKLTEEDLPLPGRWERRVMGLGALLMVAPFWGVGMELLSPAMERIHSRSADLAHSVLVFVVLGWSVATLLMAALALGGVSALRYRLAARKLPPENQPDHKPMMPWLVVAWSSGALTLALLGLPSVKSIAVAGQLGLAFLSAMEQAESERVDLILELGPDDDLAEVLLPLFAHKASVEKLFPDVSPLEDVDLEAMWQLSVPPSEVAGLMAALQADAENVDSIELNAAVSVTSAETSGRCSVGLLSLAPAVNDPLAGGQSELKSIGGWEALRALKAIRPETIATVAVIDTGVDGTHEDLRDVMSPRAISDDRSGHGSLCAGLIGAVGDNYTGITSFNLGGRFIRVRSYPALARATPTGRDVAEAIVDAADDGVDVINLSFGARGTAPTLVTASVTYALRRGVILVAAAGNDGRAGGDASEQWPANIPGVIAVGALDTYGDRASFSNTTHGVSRAVSAPGDRVCSVGAGGGYTSASGTSVSAPLVSGLLGVARALCPQLTPAAAARLLQETGDSRRSAGLGPMVRADRVIERVTDPFRGCP